MDDQVAVAQTTMKCACIAACAGRGILAWQQALQSVMRPNHLNNEIIKRWHKGQHIRGGPRMRGALPVRGNAPNWRRFEHSAGSDTRTPPGSRGYFETPKTVISGRPPAHKEPLLLSEDDDDTEGFQCTHQILARLLAGDWPRAGKILHQPTQRQTSNAGS